MTTRDFPGLDVAQAQVRKACLVLRDAIANIDTVDVPIPPDQAEAYALRLRGAAVVAHASALELAVCSGFVEAAHEAGVCGLLDEDDEGASDG